MSIKLFILFLVIFGSFGSANQLIVVVAEDMNGSLGTLKRYEKENGVYIKQSSVNNVVLGRNGLGWADGTVNLKMEGDGKSPAGLFPIVSTFGYDPSPIGTMPYEHADERLICVDDANDTRYNHILHNDGEFPKSFEWMHREDNVYRYGAVIGYNPTAVPNRGSCIFFHLNHPDQRPTSGCTAMEENDLVMLLKWLDPKKDPKLLQIPKDECKTYQKEFRGIECE